MRFGQFFCFLFVAVAAFDFDIDNNDAFSNAQVVQVPSMATTAAQTPLQTPLGREVAEVVEATTTSTTTAAPQKKPLGREVSKVVEAPTTPTTTPPPLEHLGSEENSNLPQLAVIFKPSLYSLINEGLKSNLQSFEARIASLLYEKEMVKDEIQLFVEASSSDFEGFDFDYVR